MTGCGCLVVVIGILALLVIFIRGSFDAGPPIEQAMLLLALVLAVERWQRVGSAHHLVRARRS